MKKIIDIKNLEFHYNRQPKLLYNLNLHLNSGCIHGLIGKNGEGKTTLLKLISGLIFPLNGNIDVLGFEPRKRNPEMLQDIFFLPEEILSSKLSISTFERVYAPFYPSFSSTSFYDYMSEFAIDPNISDISELSYGQKKKVLIAFGLATNARIILLDEPTNGLDIPSKRQFRRMVSSAINDKCCVLISTHQVFDLENLINNIIIMDDHKIIFNELTTNILTKLQFKVSEKKEKTESTIYAEQTNRGYSQILENKTGAESKLDIELLFNALMTDCDKINKALN
jgi:ABC-2 type transport system ATP-binding protein